MFDYLFKKSNVNIAYFPYKLRDLTIFIQVYRLFDQYHPHKMMTVFTLTPHFLQL